MQVSLGLDASSIMVCKLQKSLYGLKQASYQQNASQPLSLASSYRQSKSNYSLFPKQGSHGFIAILVYVDELVLVGDDLVEIQFMKTSLDEKFKIKDLGNLKFFLGMEVA